MILRIPIGAFLLSQETVSTMETLCYDRMFFHSQVEIREGGVAAAVPFLADKKTPALLIVETAQTDRDSILQELNNLAGVCDPETRVILIGQLNDIQFYRTLIESGISDYLLAPVDEHSLKNSISRIYSGSDIRGGGRVIAFFGASGGVGSSVVAHNVAHFLTNEQERRVTLIDMDMYFGTASLNFNFEPRHTLSDIISQSGSINPEVFSQFAHKQDDGLLIIPSPGSIKMGLSLEFPVIEGLIREAKGLSDFVILDLPHSWGPITDDTIALADELILVSRPDLSGLRNMKSLMEALGPKRKVDASTRILLNQVKSSKHAEVTDKDFGNALALSPDVSIPFDSEAFGKALNDGAMLAKAYPKSDAAKAISQVAARIALTAGNGMGAGGAKKTGHGKKGFSFMNLLKLGKSGEKDDKRSGA